MKELLQVLLQLKEVDGGDEALAGLGQAVPGQLDNLVVNEAQHSVGQRKDVFRRETADELGELPLHLRRSLAEVKSWEGWWWGGGVMAERE